MAVSIDFFSRDVVDFVCDNINEDSD